MKKLLLACILLSFICVGHAFAQNPAGSPVVHFGKTPLPVFSNGKFAPVTTTIKEILSDPKLIIEPAGSKVVSFVFSFIPKSHDAFGPFNIHGSSLTPEIINLLTGMSNSEGKIYLESIQVMDENKQARSCPSMVLNLVSK